MNWNLVSGRCCSPCRERNIPHRIEYHVDSLCYHPAGVFVFTSPSEVDDQSAWGVREFTSLRTGICPSWCRIRNPKMGRNVFDEPDIVRSGFSAGSSNHNLIRCLDTSPLELRVKPLVIAGSKVSLSGGWWWTNCLEYLYNADLSCSFCMVFDG